VTTATTTSGSYRVRVLETRLEILEELRTTNKNSRMIADKFGVLVSVVDNISENLTTEEYEAWRRRVKDANNDHRFHQSEETKKKISKAKLGRPVSEETRRKIGEAHLKSSEDDNCFVAIINAQGRCEECGVYLFEDVFEAPNYNFLKRFSARRFSVHHRNGRHWDNRLQNLELLCNTCHAKHHTKKGINTVKGIRGSPKENALAFYLEYLGIDLMNFLVAPVKIVNLHKKLLKELGPEGFIEFLSKNPIKCVKR